MADDKKTRIRWTDAEREAVERNGRDILSANPDMRTARLMELAQEVLPPERRRPGPFSATRIEWLAGAARQPDATADEPTMPRWAEAISTCVAAALAAERERTQALLSAIVKHLEADARELDRIKAAVAALHAGLSPLYESPKAVPEPEPETPSNGHANGHVNGHTNGGVPWPPSPPRVAVIGPTRDQFREIEERVGDRVELLYVERSLNRRQLPTTDYFVVSRHCGHDWIATARKAVGHENVVMVPTGGVGSIAAACVGLRGRQVSMSPN